MMASSRIQIPLAAAMVSFFFLLVCRPAHAVDKHWTWSGGGFFQAASLWTPFGVPGPSDSAFVGDLPAAHDGYILSSADVTIANLAISNGMNLLNGVSQFGMTTEAHLLGVTGSTTISSGAGGDPSRLTILDSPGLTNDFVTGSLTVGDRSWINLVEATARVNGPAAFNVGSELHGRGTLNLARNTSPSLIVDGTIFGSAAGGLTINQLGSGRIDLDGTLLNDDDDSFTINLTSVGSGAMHLTINGDQLADSYDESIHLAGSTNLNMNMSGGWTMGTNSRLIFSRNFDAPGPAVVSGGVLTFGGSMEFDYPHATYHPAHGRFDADVTFTPTATVTLRQDDRLEINGVATINGGNYSVQHGGRIDLDGPTVLHGGSFSTALGPSGGVVNLNGPTTWAGNVTINGAARQNGAATVSSATTLQGSVFDMDGSTNSDWTINAPLVLDVDALEALDDPMPNQVNSQITVNAASAGVPSYLEVQLPGNQGWTTNAEVTLNGPASPFFATTLRGSPVTVSNALVSQGNNTVTAPITIAGSALVGIGPGSLRLAGGTIASPNAIAGGSIIGVGTLAANSGTALVGHGSINNPIAFAGTAELRAKGGTLTLHGAIQDVGVIGTADATGTLTVTDTWSSGSADKVEVLGGTISGAPFINAGQTVGHGHLTMRSISNDGILAAHSGEMVVLTVSPGGTDLDGQTESGELHAWNGNLRIARVPGDAFDGSALVGAGRNLQFDNGWTNNGTLTLAGSAGNPAQLSGGGMHLLNGELVISGEALISAAGSFDPASEVQMGVRGTTLGEWDSLLLTQAFPLDGSLVLSLQQGFVPSVSDPWLPMITAPNGVIGTFASVISPIDMPLGLQYEAIYSANSVHLRVVPALIPADFNQDGQLDCQDVDSLVVAIASGSTVASYDLNGDGLINTADLHRWLADAGAVNLPSGNAYIDGDANLDGVVDGSDFNTWNAHKFTSSPGWCAGDFNADGVVDGSDFNTWNAHKFTSAITTWAIPEPTAGLMSLLICLCLVFRRGVVRKRFPGTGGT